MKHYTMYCETCMEEIYSASDISLLAKLATEHHFGHTVRITPQKAVVEVTRQKLMCVAAEVIVKVLKKNKDYGDAWQQQGGIGWAVRVADKLFRTESLASGAEALVLDESIEDTLEDNIGYSLLGLLWLKENKDA